MPKLVVDACFPAIQDVHGQVLQAFGDQLDGVGSLLAGLSKPIPKRWNRVVERSGVVRPVFEHDQIRGELVEMPSPAAAADVSLNARLEERIKLLALLRRHWSDVRHIRVPEERARALV